MITRAQLIIQFTRKNWLLVAATLICAVLGAFLSVLLPLSIGKFYETALHENSLKGRLFDMLPVVIETNRAYFLFLGVLVLAASIFLFTEKYLAGVIGEKFSRSIRELAFLSQLKQPLPVFNSKPTGKYLLRYSGDLIFIQKFITSGIIEFSSDLIYIIFSSWALFTLSEGLTLIVFAFLLSGFLLIYFLTIKLKEIISLRRNSKSALLGFVAQRFQAFSSIKAFNREKPEEEQFNKRSKKVFDFGLKYFRNRSMIEALLPFIFYSAIGFVLYDVAIMREQKPYGIKKADVFAYILILLYMQKSFRRVLKVNVLWRAGSVSYMKLLRVINRPFEMEKGAIGELNATGKISFQNVTFNYEDGTKVIENFSENISENSIVHITGNAGSGKSTLLKLVLNLFPPTSGEIFFNDFSGSKKISPKEIRRNVTIVSNDFPLIGNTIFKAISYSRAEEKRERALASLQRLKFASVDEDENILDFKLTDYAGNLSAGERKMLMFSRAFLTQKRILLLDEPFDELDDNNREVIAERLNNLRNRRTIIIASSKPLPAELIPDKIISLSK
mgnify:FL=1